MLTTIKGYYVDGRIILEETPPVSVKTEVMVTFLTKESSQPTRESWVACRGKVTIPDNFNDPLDELKDYMQ